MSAINDERHFVDFVRHHERAVKTYLVYRVRGEELRAEVFSAVFAAAGREFDALSRLPPERARRWLIEVAANKSTDAFRSEARHQRLYERLVVSADRAPPSTPDELLIRAETAAEVARRVRAVLADMPGRDRRIIEMNAYRRMTGPDIAKALDITPTAARIRLLRARRVFATKYINMYGPDIP